ncbi:MAG: hypothetical protein GY708_11575 [Actinomycetia bacterium]|nr:hypothetical protein [Actinomycetes bacterium]MCP4959375.1 hypothetical protein [Actinomycetes bacterium]
MRLRRPSTPRGDRQQFATLLPDEGDAYLRVQHTSEGPRIHVDLHVDDIEATRTHLDVGCGPHRDEVVAAHRQLGASPIERFEHWTVMSDPAAMTYCLADMAPTT